MFVKHYGVRFLFLAMLVLIAGVSWAQEDAHGRAAEEIVDQIMQNQGVGRVGAINPNEVDMELLEELGDAVMALMVADEAQHQWMDSMMGGEGSTQLASMHAWLGYNYLENDGNLAGFGPGMMGFGMMGPGGMMGGWNWGANSRGPWSGPWDGNGWDGRRTTAFGGWGMTFFWIIGVVLLTLLIALIVAVVRTRGTGGASRSGNGGSDNALGILQARYARGELSQEEYRRIKKELR